MRCSFRIVVTVLFLGPELLSAAPPPSGPTVLKSEPLPAWNARFEGKEGWIGGDAAYSCAVGPKQVVWLFGDTLIGTAKNSKREGAKMVNNTVGQQTGFDDRSTLRLIADTGAKPKAFFTPTDGRGWLWPQALGKDGDRLFIFLPQIDKTAAEGVLAFKPIATWLAVVENPTEAPEKWKFEQYRVPFGKFGKDLEQSWGSAIWTAGEFTYIYGYRQGPDQGSGQRKLLLARVPATKMLDFTAWRFRSQDGWSAKESDAVPLCNGIATEFSVTPAPGGKGYMLVTTENGLGDRIVARFAAGPEGPWSEPLLLYTCPEMAKDKGVFCYSAKAHAWATTEDSISMTYCVNTWKFGRLFQEDGVYRPRWVRVELGRKQ